MEMVRLFVLVGRGGWSLTVKYALKAKTNLDDCCKISMISMFSTWEVIVCSL